MKKIRPIRNGVHEDQYRVDGELVYLPLTEKELATFHDLIYEDWTSKVNMNKKGKTPSDIPVPPIKYHALLDKLALAEDAFLMSDYQYGELPHSKECNCASCDPFGED